MNIEYRDMAKQKIQKTKPAKIKPVAGVCGEAQFASEKF
jgi:hypothetical protein